MKVRSDFVSNSSSSSFIIADSGVIDAISMTKQDIIDALMDSYGKSNYDKWVDDHLHAYERNSDKKYCDYMNTDDYRNSKPFYVYDLNDETDRNEAISKWGKTLEGWIASRCHINDDGSLGYGSDRNEYSELIESLKNIFRISIYDSSNVNDINAAKLWIASDKKEKDGSYGHYEDAPQFLKDVVIAARKKCRIVDNAEVLKNELSRFFVHFEDNEAWTEKSSYPGKHEDKYELWDYDVAKGRTDWTPTKDEIDKHNIWAKEHNDQIDNSIYESEAYSGDRIFEIIYNWLVKIGKISSIDRKILDSYGKNRIGEWNTYDGKSFTYNDLHSECLTECWHEG